MIQKIRLRNFRNFEEFTIEQLQEKNFIIGENGKGKTNILEAIALLCNNAINNLSFDDLIKEGESVFYIEYQNNHGDTLAISYDQNIKKKKYILNGKNTTKAKFKTASYKVVSFSPIIMNMMYLSPSLRRDFLDKILTNSYPEYEQLLRDYKKLVQYRNKNLKAIHEGKSKISELKFWNEKFIEKAVDIYKYRFNIVRYFQQHISSSKEYFNGKIDNIKFCYISKVHQDTIKQDITTYLIDNQQRDIILGKTAIGPHVDDFKIQVDTKNLINYASRGETKSVIIWLKLLETVFIEKHDKRKPILVIDDLLSELDAAHEKLLLDKIKYYQTFISSIDLVEDGNIITL